MPFELCPHCSSQVSAISIFPLSFTDIDESSKASRDIGIINSKKRKGVDLDDSIYSSSSDEFVFPSADLDFDDGCPTTTTVEFLASCPSMVKKGRKVSSGNIEESGFRTGRWTFDEIAYTDKLITYFKNGKFPIPNGFKLNEFLASMLKSKQSRLTKKMKNAKLSSNSYTATHGYITETHDCIEFSTLEDKFFNSIPDAIERAEIRLHVQKEWRESFCAYVSLKKISVISHHLLKSLDELEKRISSSRDAAKMLRRQIMTGCALNLDSSQRLRGVFIENPDAITSKRQAVDPFSRLDSKVSLTADLDIANTNPAPEELCSSKLNMSSVVGNAPSPYQDEILSDSSDLVQSPFLVKVIDFIKRHQYPFEYVELWVPAISPHDDQPSDAKCVRLHFAGNAVCDTEILNDALGQSVPISSESRFNMTSFGKYSQMFSFSTGCGIPGLIYDTNSPYWNLISKSDKFERRGGAEVWGMKTVAGITVTSASVGKMVVLLLSRHERPRNEQCLLNLRQEMLKYPPNPKWKLVVEIGECKSISSNRTESNVISQSNESQSQSPHEDIISLLGEQIPFNPNCPSVDGILSLRILLLRSHRTSQEDEVVSTITASYLSYLRSGRSKDDITTLLARDFLFLQQYYAYELNAIPSIISGPTAESFWEYHDVTDESTASDTNNILNIPLSVDDNLLSTVIL